MVKKNFFFDCLSCSSPFRFSSRSQPSFICPTVPGSTLPLFWNPDGIILQAHHSHHCNYSGIYQDGYVKNESLLILVHISCRHFNSSATRILFWSITGSHPQPKGGLVFTHCTGAIASSTAPADSAEIMI